MTFDRLNNNERHVSVKFQIYKSTFVVFLLIYKSIFVFLSLLMDGSDRSIDWNLGFFNSLMMEAKKIDCIIIEE